MMLYFIIDENNQQAGPFPVDQLKSKNITETTKVWCQGMPDWFEAGRVEDLKGLFGTPDSSEIPPSLPQKRIVYSDSYRSAYSQSFTTKPVYDKDFQISDLDLQEIENYKKNQFVETFSVGLGILLHVLTLGIFTTIYCGLKHSKLPIIKSDDFDSGTAIGYLFIPFYNFYWIFMFWRRLARRINFQFKLRGLNSPVSLGLATTVCVLALIPYLGGIINIVLKAILFAQIQSATNILANENIGSVFTGQDRLYVSSN